MMAIQVGMGIGLVVVGLVMLGWVMGRQVRLLRAALEAAELRAFVNWDWRLERA